MRDKLVDKIIEFIESLGIDALTLITIVVAIVVVYNFRYFKKWNEIDFLHKAHISVGIFGLLILIFVLIVRAFKS